MTWDVQLELSSQVKSQIALCDRVWEVYWGNPHAANMEANSPQRDQLILTANSDLLHVAAAQDEKEERMTVSYRGEESGINAFLPAPASCRDNQLNSAVYHWECAVCGYCGS